jgi:hydrogenase expression/formation protein HypE
VTGIAHDPAASDGSTAEHGREAATEQGDREAATEQGDREAATEQGGREAANEQGNREAAVFERIEAFRRRRPRLRDEVVTLAHGAGGKASAALLEAVFLPAFAPPGPDDDAADHDAARAPLTDAAVVALPSGERLAFSTDSYVVKPLRFPGGSAGHLAVHGTINDLAMMGARPTAISAAFVLEEGMPVDMLREVVADMAEAASAAGVPVVTGDTKVVDRGAADQMFVTTTGVGVVPAGRELSARRVQPGDVVLASGTMGDHGMAVMLARGDLALEADIVSDTAPLHGLVEGLLAAAPSTRWLRDSTRGGVGTVCNELARDCALAVVLDEHLLPVRPEVAAACELLGIDPLYVANEGKLVAIVAPEEEDAALGALRAHPHGSGAVRIGDIHAEPPGIVVLRTTMGGTRIVDMLVGDPLPRIC